jgi:hydrogenase expression/formation protein HypC
MCIGIPMQVVEPEGAGAAWCAGRAGRQLVDMALVGPQAPGTWVLAFAGAAREVMDPQAAARTDAALDALESVLAGDASTVDAAFADLVGREPQLPEHLRPASRHSAKET